MDQETVERLLVGPVADPPNGSEALLRLLTAVRAAPRPHELTGEAAALRAFRMAQAGLLPVAASRPQRRTLAGLLSAKVALAALLVATTGGVALAAATGTLPGSLGGADEGTTPGATAGGHPSPTAGPDVSPTPATGASGRPTDSPSLVGLCTAYRAEANENRRRALETPRFAELVSAANGREKVPSYCDRLLDGRGNQADPSATGSDRPGGEPTDRVTGKPEHSPSNPGTTEFPTDRPTGPSVDGPAPTPR
ncbi:hypothetical protein DLJ46_01135 [Micromonospora globispora]|uniref:Uncharacterized protein n=2 Tax=Micromonospora globispora TaxID=1450148 RepID=A0A317KIT6_9ACTN|nr:hypothetical protein DLJ46_01135 [Micromonospora globispora]RQX07753.1 hypothetical protein DKL51_00650 [Micromonospora globispora]